MVYSSLEFTCFLLSRLILTSYSPISYKHIGEGEYLIDFDPKKSNLLRNSCSSFINRENNINSLDHYFSPFMCFSLLFIILICARKVVFSLFLDIEALILSFFLCRYMCTITGMSDLDLVKWTKSQWHNI